MKPIESKREFERFLAARHPGPGALTPRQGAAAALDFYEARRATGCDVEADGDMLLFQWGTYDWGEGEHFEVDFTRQFATPQGDDDPDLRQLSLTFRFPATDLLRGLGAGDRWCHSPSGLAGMRAFVEAAPGLAAVADRADGAVSLRIESAE
jgi:hypothetical protein